MRYAIINKQRCEQLGISSNYRKQLGNDVVITEKELSFSAAVGETVEDKAKSEGISLLTDAEADAAIAKYELEDRKEVKND